MGRGIIADSTTFFTAYEEIPVSNNFHPNAKSSCFVVVVVLCLFLGHTESFNNAYLFK